MSDGEGVSDTSGDAASLVASFLDEQAGALHRRLGEVLGVAVTVSVRGQPRTIGSSTKHALEVDHTQYQIRQGACLTALLHGEANSCDRSRQ